MNMQFTKYAWIRNTDTPAGQPAKGRINCPCGHAPESEFKPENGNVICECGAVYSWDGFVVVPAPPQITAMIFGKDRKPDKAYTPASLKAQGLTALSAEFEKHGIAASYCYLVGRHAYQKDVHTDGRQTETSKIW